MPQEIQQHIYAQPQQVYSTPFVTGTPQPQVQAPVVQEQLKPAVDAGIMTTMTLPYQPRRQQEQPVMQAQPAAPAAYEMPQPVQPVPVAPQVASAQPQATQPFGFPAPAMPEITMTRDLT